MCNHLISRLFVSFLVHGWFLAGFLVAERFISFDVVHDLYSCLRMWKLNFSLGQKQTVLLMCGLRGQLFPFGRFRSQRN